MDALFAGLMPWAHSRFTVAALLFVTVSDGMLPFPGVKVLVLAWNLCLICYYAHIRSLIIANEKACSTSLLGG